MAVLLFGKRPPKLVNRRNYPGLAKSLRKLEQMKDEISELSGRPASYFSLELCEGDTACISGQGTIALGLDLLAEHRNNDDLMLAILGHEIGHRPWTWPRFDLSKLKRSERNALYRQEEAKADRFAGVALAELGANPGPICEFFLKQALFEDIPPTEYDPAAVRAANILKAYETRAAMLKAGRSVLGDHRRRQYALR
jgi:hypothetical protein